MWHQTVEGRSVPAIHLTDIGKIPETSCLSATQDGQRAWLQRLGKLLPSYHRQNSPNPKSRSISSPSHASGRTSPSRLGTLWQTSDRKRRATPTRLRNGAVMVSSHLSAILSRR